MEKEEVAPQNIISEISYNDYIALIAHIDGEKYFLTEQESDESESEESLKHFTISGDILTAQCAKYRRALNKHLDRFYDFNKVSEQNKSTFDNHLYNPACFMAFGDNDSIVFTTSDDFYFAERLAMLSNVPVRQTSLAFCPKLDSLGITDDIFCELDKVCDGPAPSLNKDQDAEAIDAVAHPFIEERPLLVVTHYKLNGMAVLGPGLLMQQAIYKAMAKKIKVIWDELEKKTKKGEKLFTDIMSHDDVMSFRCVFLDPQGWSDIITLMFCRNYSVIVSILTVLRTLTLKDLYDEDVGGETLKDAVSCFNIHRKITQIGSEQQKKNSKAEDLLASNHVFCSTYTTLGMSHKSWTQDDPKKAGYNTEKNIVIADTHLNLCCGHYSTIKKEVETEEKYKAEFVKALSPHYSWYMVGHNDFSYQQLLHKGVDTNKAVFVWELVKQIKDMRRFETQSEDKDSFASNILESATELWIPIPLIYSDDSEICEGIALPEKEKEHIEIRPILNNIRKKLFEGEPEASQKEVDEAPRDFNIKLLFKKLLEMRVPAPLSNAILYLYTDFSNYLSDPFLFDSAIDLLDVFTAMYRLLAKKLPLQLAKLKEEGENISKDMSEVAAELDPICRSFMSEEDIDNLLRLVELLQNALSNRVQIAFQGAERWNTSVDIRGIGLDKILNTADVPLKCGLGILRRVIAGNTTAYSPQVDTKLPRKSKNERDRDIKTRIGGASSVTYNPRSLFQRLEIGNSSEFYLSSIDLNISHLTRPRAFYINFHETAHLICHFLRSNVPCEHNRYKCRKLKRMTCHKGVHDINSDSDYADFERYEEIFAEMLVHKFIFDEDHKTYFRNYLANYSLDPIAFCGEDFLTFIRLFETLFRGFLITDPFRQESKERQIYSDNSKSRHAMATGAFERFYTAVQDAGPFFFDFERLWKVHSKRRIKDYFIPAYKEAYHAVCCIWNDVQKIYDGVCVGNEEKKILGTDPVSKHRSSLIDMIEKGYEEGKPLIRVLYKDPRATRSNEKDNRLDTFFLVRHLLRTHITGIYGEEVNSKDYLTLVRDLNGNPIEPPNGRKLHTWLLDRTLNGIISTVPESRREFMQKRIVVIKTFWDISTNLRARRMKDILDLYEAK